MTRDLRVNEAPAIQIHFVQSTGAPDSIGGPGTAAIRVAGMKKPI
jgi:hypothetical protein